MKKIILNAFTIGFIMAAPFLYADTYDSTTVFQQQKWESKSTTDPFTVQNGAGITIVIAITVNDVDDTVGVARGVNVKNCGTTTHINPGDSAICTTTDPNNPVTLTSDSNKVISGTYQIKLLR